MEHIKTHAGDTAVKAKAGVEKIIRRDNKRKSLTRRILMSSGKKRTAADCCWTLS
ncbi:MAG: hypothetical protein ACLRNW_01745 [Neglectibacter sp.]